MLSSRLPPTVCAHANLTSVAKFHGGRYAGTARIALEEPRPERGLGMPVAFEMVRSRSRQMRSWANAGRRPGLG
jgi:hypothetical protein